MGIIHRPPKGYKFSPVQYGINNEPEQNMVKFGNTIIDLYHELSAWPAANAFIAWGEYGETINPIIA